MSNVLIHQFVSPKADSGDATIVQPSHWNAGHRFTGGVEGDVLIRTGTDPTFGATWLPSPMMPKWTQINITVTGTVHNFDPGIVGHTLVTCSNDAPLTITGLRSAAGLFNGQLVTFINQYKADNSRQVRFNHADHANSSPVLVNIASGPVYLRGDYASATYQYSAQAAAWFLVHHDQGQYVSMPYGTITIGATAGTWTVAPANWVYRYKVSGKQMWLQVEILSSTFSSFGAIGTLGYPDGLTQKVSSVQSHVMRRGDTGATPAWAPGYVLTGVSSMSVYAAMDGSGWTTTANGVWVFVNLIVELA